MSNNVNNSNTIMLIINVNGAKTFETSNKLNKIWLKELNPHF